MGESSLGYIRHVPSFLLRVNASFEGEFMAHA